MSNRLTILLALHVPLLFAACAQNESENKDTLNGPAADGYRLAAIQDKDNKALLFAGSGDHKEFMAEVIPSIASWFDEPDVGFTSKHFADRSVSEILSEIKLTASSMTDQGTLAIYFMTHGSPDGYILARDRVFRMKEVVDTIKAARQTPLRRLMIFVETCYSGNQIDAFGLTDVDTRGTSPDGLPLGIGNQDIWFGDLEGTGLSLTENAGFTEAVIVTSSRNNQLSYVPIFASALYKSFIDFNFEDNATIRQWLGKVREHTLADSPKTQEPMWKGIPDTVLDEKLWMPIRKPAPAGTELANELLTNPIVPDQIADEDKPDTNAVSDEKPAVSDKDEDSGTGTGSKKKSKKTTAENDSDEDESPTLGTSKKRSGKKDSGGCGTINGAHHHSHQTATWMLCLLPLLMAFGYRRSTK